MNSFLVILGLSVVLLVQRANADDATCQSTMNSVECDGRPLEKLSATGLVSPFPLFTSPSIGVECKKHEEPIFEESSKKMAQKAFDGLFFCGENEAITGLDLCFFGRDIESIAPHCRALKPGYKLEVGEATAQNSPELPREAMCEDGQAIVSLLLEKDEDWNISVTVGCAEIVKE